MTGRPDKNKEFHHLLVDVVLDSRNRCMTIKLQQNLPKMPIVDVILRYEDLSDLSNGEFSIRNFLEKDGWKILNCGVI